MKNAKKTAAIFCSMLLLMACGKNNEDKVVEGYKPIYADGADLKKVTVASSAALENPGRVYVYGDYLLINDQSKGVHIYDNSNPASPIEVSFVGIPGNLDFSVSNGMLYADNITDMVIVDISSPANPNYVNRLEDVFPLQQFPDEFGAFECVDPAKGVVVGWEKATLTNPACFK
jgi:hypothetical protein